MREVAEISPALVPYVEKWPDLKPLAEKAVWELRRWRAQGRPKRPLPVMQPENPELVGQRGYLPQASGGRVRMVPWQESATPQNKLHPDQLVDGAEPLAPRPRRTGAERLKAMTDVLVEDVKQAYLRTGTPVVAQSMVNDICRVAALEGLGFLNPAEVRRMTMEQIKPLLEAKVKRDFLRAGHKQVESDRKKVVRDWHGSANHELTLSNGTSAKTT